MKVAVKVEAEEVKVTLKLKKKEVVNPKSQPEVGTSGAEKTFRSQPNPPNPMVESGGVGAGLGQQPPGGAGMVDQKGRSVVQPKDLIEFPKAPIPASRRGRPRNGGTTRKRKPTPTQRCNGARTRSVRKPRIRYNGIRRKRRKFPPT